MSVTAEFPRSLYPPGARDEAETPHGPPTRYPLVGIRAASWATWRPGTRDDGATAWWDEWDFGVGRLIIAMRGWAPGDRPSWRTVRLVAHELLHLQRGRESNANHDPWWKFTVACAHPVRLRWGDARWLRAYARYLIEHGWCVVPATSPEWEVGDA